jgi:hypothetical protein
MIGDTNKRSAKWWGAWLILYVCLSAIHFGVSSIYDPIYDIVFEPSTNYQMTLVDTQNITYGGAYTVVWTIGLTDVRTQEVGYGHMCESSYADDSVIDNPSPYRRYELEYNVLHWFCAPPFPERGTAILYGPMYVSTTATHSVNGVMFHDVVFSATPYFSESAWLSEWIIILSILGGSACILVFFHTWNGSYLILNETIDRHNKSYHPFIAPLDRQYFDRTDRLKMIELLVMDLCRIIGPTFIFMNLRINPYSDTNGSLFKGLLYFWVIGYSVDLGHLFSLFYVYSERSWRRNTPDWIARLLSRHGEPYDRDIIEPTTWLFGSWPGIGLLIRPFLDDGDRANTYAYHDSVSLLHGLMHAQQIILMSFYFGTKVTESLGLPMARLGLTYYVLMLINVVMIAHSYWHKMCWETDKVEPYHRLTKELIDSLGVSTAGTDTKDHQIEGNIMIEMTNPSNCVQPSAPPETILRALEINHITTHQDDMAILIVDDQSMTNTSTAILV